MAEDYTLEDYLERKKLAEEAQRRADRDEGAVRQLRNELKSRYKCGTLKEAAKLLASKNRDVRELTERYRRAAEKFDEKYGDKLNRSGQ